MAGNNRTFHPFPRLPVELRSIIWDIYCAESGSCLYISPYSLGLVDHQLDFYISRKESNPKYPCAPSGAPAWFKRLHPKVKSDYHPIPINAEYDFEIDINHTMLCVGGEVVHTAGESSVWFQALKKSFEHRFSKISDRTSIISSTFSNLIHNINYLGLIIHRKCKDLGDMDRQVLTQLRSVKTIFLVLQMSTTSKDILSLSGDKLERNRFISLATFEATISSAGILAPTILPRWHLSSAIALKDKVVTCLGDRARDIRIQVMIEPMSYQRPRRPQICRAPYKKLQRSIDKPT